MVYRYTPEEAALMQKRIDTRLDTFQRNSGRGMPAKSLKEMQKSNPAKLDEHGDPILQALPSEKKRAAKLKPKHKHKAPPSIKNPTAIKRLSAEADAIKTLEGGKSVLSTRVKTGKIKKVKALPAAVLEVPTEFEECCWLWQWAKLQRWQGKPISEVLIMVPNGAYLGADRESAAVVLRKMKEAGFTPGVYDYIVPVPYFDRKQGGMVPGLWLEMKRTKGSKTSPDQIAFRDRMRRFGWTCLLGLGWVQASKIIEEHLACA